MLKTKTLSVNGEGDEFFILQTNHCAGRCKEKIKPIAKCTLASRGNEQTANAKNKVDLTLFGFNFIFGCFATVKMSRGGYT